MKRFAMIAPVVVLVIAASVFAYSRYKEHQLSPEVRAAVIAAITTQTCIMPTDDSATYIRAARLSAKTKRDFAIIKELDEWQYACDSANHLKNFEDSLIKVMRDPKHQKEISKQGDLKQDQADAKEKRLRQQLLNDINS